MSSFFQTLFTLWMAIVLTGTATHHRHPGGTGHTHGLGWTVMNGGCTSDRLPVAHCHLVLLGIELGAIPTHFYAGDSEGTHSGSGQVLSSDDSADDPLPVISLVVPNAIPEWTVEVPTAIAESVHSRTPDPCPLVSHARSGVLRT